MSGLNSLPKVFFINESFVVKADVKVHQLLLETFLCLIANKHLVVCQFVSGVDYLKAGYNQLSNLLIAEIWSVVAVDNRGADVACETCANIVTFEVVSIKVNIGEKILSLPYPAQNALNHVRVDLVSLCVASRREKSSIGLRVDL